jgi:hypothetical protein
VLRYLPTLRQLVFWGGLVLLTAGIPYGVMAYRFWNNPPKLSRNIAAELNAPVLAIPDDQKAWPIYREASMALSVDGPDQWKSRDEFRTYAYDEQVASFLKRKEADLERARQASKLPSLGHLLADEYTAEDLEFTRRFYVNDGKKLNPPQAKEPSENPILLHVLLTPAGELHDVTQALAARAWIAAREGDGKAVAENLEASIRIAGQIREIPMLVNDLVASRVYGNALKLWGAVLAEYSDVLSDDQLIRLEKTAREFADGNLLLRTIAERGAFYDLLQRIYTDDGEGDGYVYLPNVGMLDGGRPNDDWYTRLIAPLATSNLGSRREAARAYDELMTLLEAEIVRPFWECDCRRYDAAVSAYEGNKQYSLVTLMATSAHRIHTIGRDAVQQRDATLTASALVRFRRKHGKWPTTLESLVPEYLAKLPLDELTGKPLRYRITDSRPRLYSVGFDGVDDQGQAGSVESNIFGLSGPIPWEWSFGAGIQAQPKGDLILWPTDFSHIEPPPPIDPYVP